MGMRFNVKIAAASDKPDKPLVRLHLAYGRDGWTQYMTATEAREMAAALLAKADELAPPKRKP
jgi:hypothetical protein